MSVEYGKPGGEKANSTSQKRRVRSKVRGRYPCRYDRAKRGTANPRQAYQTRKNNRGDDKRKCLKETQSEARAITKGRKESGTCSLRISGMVDDKPTKGR